MITPGTRFGIGIMIQDQLHDLEGVLNLNGIFRSTPSEINLSKELLLFGGHDGQKTLATIHKYDIVNNNGRG